jgi:hypothetical protein
MVFQMTRHVPTLSEFVLRALAETFVRDAVTDAEDDEGAYESQLVENVLICRHCRSSRTV